MLNQIDSDQEEEPKIEICQIERHISEDKPQATSVDNMTPLAQSNLKHGQDIVDPKLDSIVTPVDHAGQAREYGTCCSHLN